MKYSNPVISGFHPDPSICRVGEDYYLVTSTFEYFPGVPIFHSRDLVHWRQLGHCLTNEQQLPLTGAGNSGGVYAPTLRYHNGWFYMTTTNLGGGGNFYVRAQQPEGPWSEPIFVDQGGIDPSILFDDDGRIYYQTACNGDEGEGIYQCEIDIATGSKLTKSRLIWRGTGGAAPEAPHLYKTNGMYYLMLAEGGTEYGHMVTIARSQEPYGPFEPYTNNPILSNRSMPTRIHATGHADLVEAEDGSWWAVCLGIRPVSYPMRHHLGRETFLAAVTWTEDGWPVIGEKGHIYPEMDGPNLPKVPWPARPVRDDFDAAVLGHDWNTLRNAKPGSWSLTEQPGSLVLRGNPDTLSSTAAPAFIGRRLSHFSADIAAALDYEPLQEGEEAGLAAYMNSKYHYELVVKRKDGQKKVVFRRTVGSLMVEQELDCEAGPLVLSIKARPEWLHFSVQQGESEAVELGSGETHLLSTEVAGGFTGVMIAMVATSPAGQGSPASFDWFDYKPLESF
ncbi:glycoside hydrolase family 43 protein [Paenibacillus sp. JX-17]|uniref:Glycoside hydrolase family 43 protein n=1 Tax=Paenibacillus lacisoli TaxID=3064525 RepID=A0ABT9CHH6_9BACL|nr:glycoside hydrolase family 43 protein [Paenibacillus sp. JX-17]MDO7908732.1 glycoside hydrolase family 43 protein [Paenibacillus sp. JX-17]